MNMTNDERRTLRDIAETNASIAVDQGVTEWYAGYFENTMDTITEETHMHTKGIVWPKHRDYAAKVYLQSVILELARGGGPRSPGYFSI